MVLIKKKKEKRFHWYSCVSSPSLLLLSSSFSLLFQGKEASSLASSKDLEITRDQSQPESGVQPDLFEENFKELKKWVDLKSSKYGTLLVLRERRSGRLGTALKVFFFHHSCSSIVWQSWNFIFHVYIYIFMVVEWLELRVRCLCSVLCFSGGHVDLLYSL